MTKFEIAQEQVSLGRLIPPTVSNAQGKINYFSFQLSVHLFNMKLMARGMKFRGVKLKDLKAYYGLKGKSAADCLIQFETIKNEYFNRFKEEKISSTPILN